MNKLAIFTAPKPFTNPHIAMIQRNAILNWKALGDQVEVFLVGDEPGIKEVAAEYKVKHLPDVLRNSFGTPRVDSIFDLVRNSSAAALLCYVNADILFLPDLLTTIDLLVESEKDFLAVGQRWDIDIKSPILFQNDWQGELTSRIDTEGNLHKPAGSDYFVFKRSNFTEIPPFAIGRAGWDNWMIFKGRQDHLAVVDCTKTITVIHQQHDFHHLPNGLVHRLQPETLQNVDLAGGYHTMFQLSDTNYSIDTTGLHKKKLDRWRLIREISIFPAIALKSRGLGELFFDLFYPEQSKKNKKRRDQIQKKVKPE